MDHGGEMKREDVEVGRTSSAPSLTFKDGLFRTLLLAFQSIGVVYGDIGTSPLYVFASAFPNGIRYNDDILGILSLVIYTLILIPMIKYVFIVLQANDQGDGGTFALYSLICRYARVGLIPNHQEEDAMVSNYKLKTPSINIKRAEKIKRKLEGSILAKILIFLTTILATSMVLGDGILTPCISDAVIGITVAILMLIFSVQRFGTEKVGYSFAPIIVIWFTLIGGIGFYNFIKYDVKVLRAFNPKYIIYYFKRNGRDAWISLGGVVLCITGTEAMFADLGHFNLRAIQISFSAVLFPAISLAYIGQGAYLTKFPEDVSDTFYKSIPNSLYWPSFIVAIAAAIIASQAMISGAFAVISQSLALGCFPRVKVVHTSSKNKGQVYIPEVNYMLMVACIVVTTTFKTTEKIGNAYGIAVVSVMLITTCLVSLVMLVIWKTSIWIVAIFFVVFGGIELVYFSSSLYKFKDGGFLPLSLSFFLMSVMATWHYVQRKKYLFELKNKVPIDYVHEVTLNPKVRRIPGMGLLYSELVEEIPPIFPHLTENVPSIHSIFIFVSIKRLPIRNVSMDERFLFKQIGPREDRIFRCTLRCGYKDILEGTMAFEEQLVDRLKSFVHGKQIMPPEIFLGQDLEEPENSITPCESSRSIDNNVITSVIEDECLFIQNAKEEVVVYILGEVQVVAGNSSCLLKKIIVNHLYDFLRRNFRQGIEVLPVPQKRLLRVGMTYEI